MVFKKLVKSGWYVGPDVLRQIFGFLKVKRSAIAKSYELKTFLKEFISSLGMPAHDLDVYMPEEEEEL